jgi:hypothetical protein
MASEHLFQRPLPMVGFHDIIPSPFHTNVLHTVLSPRSC